MLSLAQTATRSELQQLTQLNTELSARVTVAADEAELLQHRLTLLTGEESGPPPAWPSAGDRVSSERQPPSGDGSGSYHSAAGRHDSAASVGSSPRHSLSQGRRPDRNVALRHLPRTEPEPDQAAAEAASTADDTRSLTATPVLSASASASGVGTGAGDGPSGDGVSGAASGSLPSREINFRVMHDVTLTHHDELDDCDLLYLNLRADEPSLDTLCHDLAALSDDPRYALRSPPRRDHLVFARWDGAWYRGRVIGTPAEDGDGPAVEVQFVDYGNRDTVLLSECRRLPERLTRMPECAVACTLAGAVTAPTGWLRQLQLLLIEALLPSDAAVKALFQRASGDGPLRAQLAVPATVGEDSRLVDVGRTLSNVLAVSPQDAREQVRQRTAETLVRWAGCMGAVFCLQGVRFRDG